MFRAIVFQRSALDEMQVADIGVVSATIKEDKTQKATSKIVCQKIPTSVGINDLLLMYNSKGIFTYWGVITGIDDKTLTCSQFEGLWNDNEMIVAQTSTNQKAFYNNSTISNIVKFYLSTKSQGYANIVNTMSSSYVPTYTGLLDTDVANNFKGIRYNVTDSVTDYMPFPRDKYVQNLETFLYEIYNTYNRIIRPHYTNVSELPTGYTKLKYIESSGTQYINTGVTGSNNLRVKTEISDFSSTTSVFLFGSRTALSSNRNGFAIIDSNYRYDYNTGTQAFSFGLTSDKMQIDYNKNGCTISVNGTTYSVSKESATFSNNVNLTIFANNTNGTIAFYSSAKLYSMQIYVGNVLKRNFIPAKRNTDSVLGLYDLANDVFYTNQGTGSFSGEVDVEQRSLNIECFYPTGIVNGWDYNSKSLFDSWECISNLSITKEEESTNSVYVYNNEGTALRGAYTIKNDGTIVQISGAVANRLGSNKTKFIYDTDNVVLDLVKNELPSLQYNHKITFNINFGGEYGFNDFNLGMPIKFYSTDDNHLYDSCLSAWEYSIKENSDDILSAKFTLGKVRSSLTSKLNKKND